MLLLEKLLHLILGLVLAGLSIYIGTVTTYLLPYTSQFGEIILRPFVALLWALVWGILRDAITLETQYGGASVLELHTHGVLAFCSAFLLVMVGAYPGVASILGVLWWLLVIIAYACFVYAFTQFRAAN